jgi:hypothetical protein
MRKIDMFQTFGSIYQPTLEAFYTITCTKIRRLLGSAFHASTAMVYHHTNIGKSKRDIEFGE